MHQIVQLTTQDVSRAIPVTTSLIVAEQFGKDHAKVLRDIRELAEQLEEVSIGQSDFGQSYFVGESEYINEQNKKQPMYQMNEDFWMMLVMGYTGKKALLIKHEFIKQFRKMKHELMARAETRHIGKNARLSLTDSINNHVENTGNFKKFAYGNYTKLVYKKVLGMECKKAKELRNVPEKGNLRDYLLPEELDKVQDIESKIAGFIAVSDTEGKNDKEIYQMVKEWIDKKEII